MVKFNGEEIVEEWKVVSGERYKRYFIDSEGTELEKKCSDLSRYRALTFQHLGVNTVLISDGRTNIMVDPYFSRPEINIFLFTFLNFFKINMLEKLPIFSILYNRDNFIIKYPRKNKAERVKEILDNVLIDRLDAILVTHTHFDHALDIAEVWHYYQEKSPASPPLIMGSQSAINICKRYFKEKNLAEQDYSSSLLVVPPAKKEYLKDFEEFEVNLPGGELGDFKVTFIKGKHIYIPGAGPALSKVIPDGDKPLKYFDGYQEGECTYQILIENDNCKSNLLVQGSANYYEGFLKRYLDKKQKKIDVLFVPLAGGNQALTGMGGEATFSFRDRGIDKLNRYFDEVIAPANPTRVYFTHWDQYLGVPLNGPAQWFMDAHEAAEWLLKRFYSRPMSYYKTVGIMPRWDIIRCYTGVDREYSQLIDGEVLPAPQIVAKKIESAWQRPLKAANHSATGGFFPETGARGEAKGLKILHLGASTVYISDGKTGIMIDPYFTRSALSTPDKSIYTLKQVEPADREEIHTVLESSGIERLEMIILTHSCFQYIDDIFHIWDYYYRKSPHFPPLVVAAKPVIEALKVRDSSNLLPFVTASPELFFPNPLATPTVKINGNFNITIHADQPVDGNWFEGRVKCYTDREIVKSFHKLPQAAPYEHSFRLYLEHPLGRILYMRAGYVPVIPYDRSVDILLCNLYQLDRALSSIRVNEKVGEVKSLKEKVKEDFIEQQIYNHLPHRIYFIHWDNYNDIKLTEDAQWLDRPYELIRPIFRGYRRYHSKAEISLMPRWEYLSCPIEQDRRLYCKEQRAALKETLFRPLPISSNNFKYPIRIEKSGGSTDNKE